MQIRSVSTTPKFFLLVSLALFIVAALIATLTDTSQAVEILETPLVPTEPSVAPDQIGIRVEVSGGVTQPGVISLPEAHGSLTRYVLPEDGESVWTHSALSSVLI